jgi:hypothetical protein
MGTTEYTDPANFPVPPDRAFQQSLVGHDVAVRGYLPVLRLRKGKLLQKATCPT